MRVHAIKLYSFNELDDDAKDKARQKYRENNTEIFYYGEIFDSLKAIFKTTNISITDYSLGLYQSHIKFDLKKDIYALEGTRALGWLENTLFSKLRITRSEYLKNRKAYFSYGTDYRIGCIKPCPFTGVCFDEDFIADLLDSIKKGSSLGEAFTGLTYCYEKLLHAEYEDQNSDEYIDENFINNDYEFTKGGDLY